MNARASPSQAPIIGILGWEAGHEDTLSQLESLPGNIAHPETFRFPVVYRRVAGAFYRTVVEEPNTTVLAAMIAAAREIVAQGVRAITTNCGFNAIFQRQLADAVAVPCFSSSLIQVPLALQMLRDGEKVGVMTADKAHLTAAHLDHAGITPLAAVRIVGLDETEEFPRIRADPTAVLDVARLGREVVALAAKLVAEHPDVGAIVLECTDLPPFAAAIRRAVGLPVFDVVTLTNMVYETLVGDPWR